MNACLLRLRLASFTFAVAAVNVGCESSSNGAASDELNDGPLTRGGDLFVNTCREVGAELVCSPFRMRIVPGVEPRTETARLPEVRQANLGGLMVVSPGAILQGSTVDRKRGRVFWHAGCNSGYHVTEMATGATQTFALDLAKLGLADPATPARGFCLAEWAYDERRGEAIALGGLVSEGRSTIGWALAVDANGGARVLHDLRGQLGNAVFLHPFQTLSPRDPARDEILAPFANPDGTEGVVVVNLTTGALTRRGTVGCWLHAFFDEQSKKPTFFDCFGPGWTSTTNAPPERRITIPGPDLSSRSIEAHVGGGYDPNGQAFMLMRPFGADQNPNARFSLGVANLVTNRWRGFLSTDLRVADAPGNGPRKKFVMSEFVPSQAEPLPPADAVTNLATGAAMFVGVCRPVGQGLTCEPWRISVTPGPRPTTRTTRLPDVVQERRFGRDVPPDPAIALWGLMGSTVDPRSGRVYWHAGCAPRYHVTDLDSGATRTFPLDLAALGIADDGNGLCLGEWVYDEQRDVAIALAGKPTLGATNGDRDKSRVEYALALGPNGEARLLHDLRPRVDPRFMFLHQFQTIASYDPARDEILAPLSITSVGENQLRLNVRTGQVELVGAGGGARQWRFFDRTARTHSAWDCSIPGWTNSISGPGTPGRIAIDRGLLAARGIPEPCGNGFVGGGYDPVGKKAYVLLRNGPIVDANRTFTLGIADLEANRFLGFIDTDATYGALGLGSVGAARLFLATELVPQ
jgi:hypothetical protein